MPNKPLCAIAFYENRSDESPADTYPLCEASDMEPFGYTAGHEVYNWLQMHPEGKVEVYLVNVEEK